jgi:hypothetical protein
LYSKRGPVNDGGGAGGKGLGCRAQNITNNVADGEAAILLLDIDSLGILWLSLKLENETRLTGSHYV